MKPKTEEKTVQKKESSLKIILIAAVVFVAIVVGIAGIFILVDRDFNGNNPARADRTLGNAWYNMTFRLDGHVYQLPLPFSELEEAGFRAYVGDSDTLLPLEARLDSHTRDNTIIRITNGQQSLHAYFFNPTENALTFGDSYIFGLEINREDLDFMLPDEIGIHAGLEEVVAAFGRPTYIEHRPQGLTYIYASGFTTLFDELELTFQPEASAAGGYRVSNISMRNGHLMEEDGFFPALIAAQAPQEVLDYVAPTALGTTLDSLTLRFANHYYAIPAPVSAFVDNGWRIVGTATQVLMGNTRIVTLFYENQLIVTFALDVEILGLEEGVEPQYLIVTELIYNRQGGMRGANVDFELPGGITRDSTREEIVEAFGEPDQVSFSGDYTFTINENESIIFEFDGGGNIERMILRAQ